MKLCDFTVGIDQPFFLIAGPCVIETEQFAIDTAGQLKEITQHLNIPFIYKSSFDKANRTSVTVIVALELKKDCVFLKLLKNKLAFLS